MTMSLTSPAFGNNEAIPRSHTCDAENRSPELRWSELPAGTLSLALILDDPDASFGVFTHWVLYNIRPTVTKLPAGQPKTPLLPGIGTQGVNDFRRNGYDGPCPPPGRPHRYVFHLYALDLAPDLSVGFKAGQLQSAMRDHILAQAEWMGKYSR